MNKNEFCRQKRRQFQQISTERRGDLKRMKFTTILLSLFVAKQVAALSEEAESYLLNERFESFKEEFDKVYEDEAEEERRKAIFEANLEEAVRKNSRLANLGEEQIHGITKVGPARSNVCTRRKCFIWLVVWFVSCGSEDLYISFSSEKVPPSSLGAPFPISRSF